jgi:predicted phage tail protein
MINLYLHGHLKEKYGDCYTLAVDSPQQGVHALCQMVPGFKSGLLESDYHVIVGEGDAAIDLGESDLGLVTERDVHLIPAIEGANNGAIKIVTAAALIALSFIPGIGQIAQVGLLSVGASLGLQGIAALISPQNKTSNSYVFNGEQVTLSQGSAIPLLYGEMMVNLVPISASITNETTGPVTENPTYGGTDGWAQADNTIANPFNQPSYT